MIVEARFLISVCRGGGIEANAKLNRTRPSLRWMYLEASSAGLRFNPFKRGVKDERLIKVNESLTWMWRPLEVFPFRRLKYTADDKGGDITYLYVFDSQSISVDLMFIEGPTSAGYASSKRVKRYTHPFGACNLGTTSPSTHRAPAYSLMTAFGKLSSREKLAQMVRRPTPGKRSTSMTCSRIL